MVRPRASLIGVGSALGGSYEVSCSHLYCTTPPGVFLSAHYSRSCILSSSLQKICSGKLCYMYTMVIQPVGWLLCIVTMFVVLANLQARPGDATPFLNRLPATSAPNVMHRAVCLCGACKVVVGCAVHCHHVLVVCCHLLPGMCCRCSVFIACGQPVGGQEPVIGVLCCMHVVCIGDVTAPLYKSLQSLWFVVVSVVPFAAGCAGADCPAVCGPV